MILPRPAIITRRAVIAGAAALALAPRDARATTLAFDPSAKGSNVVLRGNGYTMDGNGYVGNWQSAAASSAQTGDLYYEYQFCRALSGATMLGFANSGIALNDYLASNSSGVGLNQQAGNDVFFNGAQTGESSGSGGWAGGKILRVASSTGADRWWVWFGSGWVPSGDPVAKTGGFLLRGISGIRPAMSTFNNAMAISLGNFPMLDTVPSGYSTWNTGLTTYTAGVTSLDPTNTSSFVTLSLNNLRGYGNSGTANAYQLAYATKAMPARCRAYFEVRVDGMYDGSANKTVQVGLRRGGLSTTNNDIDNGTDVGIAYNALTGTVTANGTTLATLTAWPWVGSIVGLLVDTFVDKVWFSLDGVFDGNPNTGSGGYSIAALRAGGNAIYPCVGIHGNLAGNLLGLNFGGYAFQGSLPTASASWDDAVAGAAGGRSQGRIL